MPFRRFARAKSNHPDFRTLTYVVAPIHRVYLSNDLPRLEELLYAFAIDSGAIERPTEEEK
jgi:hypothetical protein